MLGVVLIDFNSYERTRRYVEDILSASDITIDEIVIIDNSPRLDNFKALLDELRKIGLREEKLINKNNYDSFVQGRLQETIVIVAKSKENLGFAKANNCGFAILKETIKPEYVLFSNSDIQFVDGIVEITKLISAFDKDNVGLVGPLVVGLDEKQQSPCKYLSIYSRWWKPTLLWPFNRGRKSSETIELSEPGYVYRLIGAFMLASSVSFEKIGGFDEHTFLYGEECILSERYKQKGLRVFCDPCVKIIHEGGYTTNTNKKDYAARDRKAKRRLESDLYYYEKYIHVKPWIIQLTRIFTRLYIFKLHIKDRIVK